MTCQAPTPCEMTSQPGRRSEACIKGRQETIKMLQTLITSCLLPTSPSPNHAPSTPTNTPNLWDSNAIHHIQFDGELQASQPILSRQAHCSYAGCLIGSKRPVYTWSMHV